MQYPYLLGHELDLPSLFSCNSRGPLAEDDMRGAVDLIKQVTIYVPELVCDVALTDCPGSDDADPLNTQARLECSAVGKQIYRRSVIVNAGKDLKRCRFGKNNVVLNSMKKDSTAVHSESPLYKYGAN